jgi:gamma-glutamyltranspeptidase/glutathione hydrolase
VTLEDLAAHTSTWVQPISARYRGYDVWELPPNGQGLGALLALNILEGLDLPDERDSAEAAHLQIEAVKLAFADILRFVADPARAEVPVDALLGPEYTATRRALIGQRAAMPVPGTPTRGGTVYLCAADSDGMMVSFIQSNYQGFGSGVVVPGTGVALHNRGLGFSTQSGHPNVLEPGKRPFHTIIPGFLTHQGQSVGPFGVMGGFMQIQGHVQMMVNSLRYGNHPQTSLDAPRWRFDGGLTVAVEPETPSTVVEGLRERGHRISIEPADGVFGRGQIIWRLPGGGYMAGSDKRGDGQVAAY